MSLDNTTECVVPLSIYHNWVSENDWGDLEDVAHIILCIREYSVLVWLLELQELSVSVSVSLTGSSFSSTPTLDVEVGGNVGYRGRSSNPVCASSWHNE